MTYSPRMRFIAVAVLLVGGLTSPLSAQNVGRAAARTWNTEVVLPPGAYRAGKPIQNGENLKVRVQPGTVMDGVEFAGDSGAKWNIEGSLLRKVKIVGGLGTRVEAKDSGFDDCELHKSGGWFVSWWGTKWRFDNCVIGKQFMVASIGVQDYSVTAVNCTFVGVKMPAISFKDNPAKYFQGNDLKFEKCRFVQCEIPESVLAATIDCVFEGCRFDAKRSDWSKAASTIKVNAIIAGTGQAPKSYLNGPLAVNFVSGAGTGVGSTLAYTTSGGRINLTAVRPPGQFTMLGTVDKKASELSDAVEAFVPVVATTTPPVLPGGTPPPAPTSPAVAANSVRTLDEMLRTLPASVELMAGGQVNISAVETANAWLAQSYNGKAIALRTKLEQLEATKDGGYAFKVVTREQPLAVRGAVLPGQANALFRADRTAGIARVTKGGDLTVMGVIDKVEIVGRGRGLAFVVTIGEAQTP